MTKENHFLIPPEGESRQLRSASFGVSRQNPFSSKVDVAFLKLTFILVNFTFVALGLN